MEFTRLTNLEVTGTLKQSGLTAGKVTAADAAAAAGATPTKVEFDALVTLANANKAAINALIKAQKGE